MAKVEYKFKPYTPKNLKMAKPKSQLENLKRQRDNLDKRLRAEGVDPETLGGEFDNRNFLEKALNLTPDQGVLFDFFEIINRPTEAIKAAVVAGSEGQDVLEAAWKGLSGETVTRGQEILDLTGIDLGDSPVADFVENVAVDITLDPLNLLPAGFFLKKFGKLFTRSKTKLIQQFTGNLLDTFGQIRRLDGTQAVFKNIDELNDFLRNASPEEVINIQKQLDSLAKPPKGKWTGDVFEKGAKPNQAGFNYGRTFEDLKERADKLLEYKKGIDKIEDSFKAGKISQQERVKQINELLPGSFKGRKIKVSGADVYVKEIKQQVLTELDLYSDALEITKRYGDDFDVVLNKTSNRIDDVTIVKKVKVGEKEYYVKALGIEAKTAESFYLKTASIVYENGKAALKVGGKAFDFSPRLRQRFDDVMKQTIKSGPYKGKTVNEVFGDIVEGRLVGRRGKVKKSLKIADLLDRQGKEQFKELVVDMYKEASGGGPIYFKPSGGKGFFLGLDDAKQYINIDAATIGYTKTGSTGKDQLRMLGYAGLDLSSAAKDGMSGLEVLIGEGKAYGMAGLMEQKQNLAEVARTADVNIFEFYKDKPGLIGNFAEVGNKFINFMKEKFSAYGFLTEETAAAARRLKGETAVQYQTRMLRLANIRDSFQKQFPGISDRYLAQLVESGARIENGALVFADRTITLKDYIRGLIESSDAGNPGFLRKFARGKERAFLNKLNEVGNAWAGTTDEVFFEIVEKRGVKVLQTNLDSSELKKILEGLDLDAGLGLGRFKDDFLDYGLYSQVDGSELKLAAEAENIVRNWDEYSEFVDLHHDVQRMLVEEGGYTNFLNELGELNDTYLRHMMTKQAYEYLSKNQPGVLSKFAKPGSQFFKSRKYLGTIDEVNDYLKAIYDLDMEVFDPSAFRAAEDFFKYAFRNIEQGRLMELLLSSKDKFGEGLLKVVDNTKDATKALKGENVIFTSFREEFPQLVKNLSGQQMSALEGYLSRAGLSGNRAIVMNKTIHRVIKESEKAFKALDDLTIFYDKFLNTWKGLTLVTPGFHLRNLFGNMFNSYAVGMDTIAQLKYTRIGMLELSKFDEAVKLLAKGTKMDDLPKAMRKAYDNVIEFRKSGLIQSHRGVRDLEQLKEASELAAQGNLAGARKIYNDVIRFNFNLAERMDDTQRYILYRWGLDKTKDSVQAAKIVTESLFDYSALTGFEKDVMKRLFPFYTFMKNNFVFHAKNILRNPKAYARTGRAYKYYLEDIAGYGPDDLPDYMTESMWIPIPMMVTKNDKEGVAFLKANLPITDFIELVQNPFEKGVQSVTVPVKMMIEVGSGRDMFTGQPITKFPGETDVMEEGTGVLSNLRNRRGQLTIFQTPLAQKILNDLGGRTVLNVGTVGLDLLDTLMGYQGPQSGFTDFLERAGVVSGQEVERLELTTLYQDLENLRNLKRIYEQETENQLPVLPRG